MKKFSEVLKEVEATLDGLITKDTPTDQIEQIGKAKEKLADLDSSHKQTLEDYGALKDKYIDAVKNFGTGKAPANEIDDSNKEKSLEEIGAEIISNRGKQK